MVIGYTKKTFLIMLSAILIIATGCIQPPPKSKTAGSFGENPTTPRVNLSAGTTTLTESNTTISIPISLDKASPSTVTVSWKLINVGSAPTASAFPSQTGSISFPAGFKNTNISLTVTDDGHFETNEVVYLQIYNPQGALLGSQKTKLITVIDNDTASKPTLYFPSTSLTAAEDAGTLSTAVAISGPLNVDVTIPYMVYGDASYPSDHGLQSGSLTIPAGQVTGSISLPVVDDTLKENTEVVYIELLGVSELELGTAKIFQLLITDNEVGAEVNWLTPVTISASEDVGSITATISLAFEHGVDTTFTLSTSGSATNNTDYSLPTSVTIPAGATSSAVTINIVDDALDEFNQTIEYIISSTEHGTIGSTDTLTITILDDDAEPTISIDSAGQSFNELSSGQTLRSILVSLSATSEKTVTIDYALSGTATYGGDYDNFTGLTGTSTGLITFLPGITSADLSFTTNGDIIDEYDETIIFSLTATSQVNGVAGGIVTHTATIQNDDDLPVMFFSDASNLVDEDHVSISVTLNLVLPSEKIVTVDFSGATGTATGGGVDYDFPNGSVVTFNPGDTATSLLISFIDDGVDLAPGGNAETIELDLSGITNSATDVGYQDTYTLTLIDVDTLSDVSFTTTTATVTENGATSVLVYAELDNISARDITFDLEFSGTATTATTLHVYAGVPINDVNIANSIIIPAGSATALIDVGIVDDTYVEATESLTFSATNIIPSTYATISTIASATFDLDIIDNDATVALVRFLEVNPIIVSEGATDSIVSIELFTSSEFGFDVDAYVIFDATSSTANASPSTTPDFNWPGSITGIATITIPAYSRTATMPVTIINDISDELDTETIVFNIDSVSAEATIGSVDTVTINLGDDDDPPEINFLDATVNATEGETITATITLTATSALDITATVQINSGLTTAAPTDYSTLFPASFTILAGATTATISSVIVTNDVLDENDESLMLELGDITNGSSGTQSLLDIVLIDNDIPPIISYVATTATVNETNNDIVIIATITLNASSGRDLYFDFIEGPSNTANFGSDYNTLIGTATVPAGALTYYATITIVGDQTDELNKVLDLQMTNEQNVTLGASNFLVDIIDDDTVPVVSFATDSTSFAEGGSGYSFNVVLSATSELDVSVELDYNPLTNASQTLGVDHTFATGSLTIPAGTVSVNSTPFAVINDGFFDQEVIVLDIASTVNATIGLPSTITATLTDSSAAPSVSLLESSTTIFENGEGGPATYNATFQQTFATGVDTQIYFQVQENQSASTPGDYTLSHAGVITIPAGSTQAILQIQAPEDPVPGTPDARKSITITISSVVGANIQAPNNLLVNINDSDTIDDRVYVDPTSVTVTEGNTTAITFQISEVTTVDVTMSFVLGATSTAKTSDITSSLGNFSTPIEITIPAGSISQTVTFTTVNDLLQEDPEVAEIEINDSSGDIHPLNATCSLTINDDSDLPPSVSFVSGSSEANESDAQAQFTFILSRASGKEVYVPFSIAAGSTTASAGDYTAPISLTATIPAEQITTTVTFALTQDLTDENDETVAFQMGSPTNATIGGGITHIVTIKDMDPTPSVSFQTSSISVNENVGQVGLVLTLTATSEKSTSIPYSWGPNHTATLGDDYTLPYSGTFSMDPGVPTKTVTITIIDDTVHESDEVIDFVLGAPTNLELGTTITASVEIVDDDAPPTVQFSAATSTSIEGNSLQLTFSLSSTSGSDITVPFVVDASSTASGSVDHNILDGSVVIPAGQSTASSGNFVITDDVLTEGDETIVVVVGPTLDASQAIINRATDTATHTITIQDNDTIKVAIGLKHTCTLVDGGVYCWGDNSRGQRGMGTVDLAFGDDVGETATSLLAGGTVNLGTGFVSKQIVAGKYHTCALSTAGQVKCWGDNQSGQCGQAVSVDPIGDSSADMGDNLLAITIASGLTATNLTAGSNHTCALLSNGSIKCWGSNFYGQIGQPSISYLDDPTDIFNASSILFQETPIKLFTGGTHNCALFVGPGVECWGRNQIGQLGYDNSASDLTRGEVAGDFSTANFVDLGSDIVDLSLGGNHACIQIDSTDFKCWGDNSKGQLGLGDSIDRGDGITFTATPFLPQTNNTMAELPLHEVLSGPSITKITAGQEHTCVLYNDSTVRCWGANDQAQLGIDDSTDTAYGDAATETATTATPIDFGADPATDLFSGGNHNCISVGPRSIKCWGDNDFGQLLQESTDDYGSNGTNLEVTDSATLGF